MATAREHQETVDELYREMKTSHGGVMLLVRLAGDLMHQPKLIETILTETNLPEPDIFEKGSRLEITFSWLEKKFGRTNAINALREVAEEIVVSSRLTKPPAH